MDKDSFYFLYVNINSLLDISLRESVSTIVADLENDAQSVASQAPDTELDLGSLDDLDWDFLGASNSLPSENNHDLGRHEDLTLDVLASKSAATPESHSSETDGFDSSKPRKSTAFTVSACDIDYEQHVQFSYQYANTVQKRIDRIHRRAEASHIEPLLQLLPTNLPPLTRRLSGEEFKQWVELDNQKNEGLTTLALYLMSLTPDSETLDSAIRDKNTTVVEQLLDDFDITEHHIYLAAQAAATNIFKLLLQKYTPSQEELENIFSQLLNNENAYKEFYTVVQPPGELSGALFAPAFYHGTKSIVNFLIEKIDLNNVAIYEEELPLVFAIRRVDSECVSRMLAAGADPSSQGKYGTPLDFAKSYLPEGHLILDLLQKY